jgi:hypothetical protein
MSFRGSIKKKEKIPSDNLLERALNHWSGLKERRMDRDWDVPNKQNAWKKERLNAEKAEELRKKGFSGMSKHAITRHEHSEARKKAAVTNSAEAEATIAADYDAAIADEAGHRQKCARSYGPCRGRA